MPLGWLAVHSKVRLPLHDAALTAKRLNAVSRPRNTASSCCYLCALKGALPAYISKCLRTQSSSNWRESASSLYSSRWYRV